MRPTLLVAIGLLTTSPARAQQAALADSVLRIGDDSLHYQTRGRGVPVLLLHGFGGRLEEMDNLAASLAGGYKVIALDLQGFGRSSAPEPLTRYGAVMVDHVIGLLDHLHERRVHLVGYSMGATLAAAVAARHPERVRSLTLIGAMPLRSGSIMLPLVDSEASALKRGDGLRPLIVGLNPVGAPLPSDSAIVAISREDLAGHDSLAWAAALLGMHDFVLSDSEAHALAMPILALFGTADPLRGDVAGWAGRLPRLRVDTLSRATHNDVLGHAALAGSVRGFLKSVDAQGRR
ncbi:MAG TPA: alpha/beta fold hydrolase [Gemmatimonadales bacterium]|nr:alpha/beta fold hydrolase [Gemmatimonadales bacterium]